MKKTILSFTITLLIIVFSFGLAAAHGGRTDGSGGHKDNQNKSGLGSYHYHCGGNSAHLHNKGQCPYRAPVKAPGQPPLNTQNTPKDI